MVLLHRPPSISAKRVLDTRGTMQADGRRRGDGQGELVGVLSEAAELPRRHAVSCFGCSFRKRKKNVDRHHSNRLSPGGGSLALRAVPRGAGLPRQLSGWRDILVGCYFFRLCVKFLEHRPLTISATRVQAIRGTMQADKRRRGDGHRKAVDKAAAPEDMKTWSEFCARLCACACARACVCLCASVCLCVCVCALARTPNSVCLIAAWTQNRACTFPLCLLPRLPRPVGRLPEMRRRRMGARRLCV
jgi:hypothetical protein